LILYDNFPHLSSTPPLEAFLYGNLGCFPYSPRHSVRKGFSATGKYQTGYRTIAEIPISAVAESAEQSESKTFRRQS
jgi:hypothetical protein